MVGTLLGALIIGVINNGMNMLSVPYFYQLIVKGLVILIAVWLDVRSKRPALMPDHEEDHHHRRDLVEIMAVDRPATASARHQPLVGPFPSGAPAIFIDQVAKLGQPCAIVSAVGNDDFGASMSTACAATAWMSRPSASIRRAATGSAFVRYRAGRQPRLHLTTSATAPAAPSA
jgi:sugar/nucleoside kinase (ribokinase family)